MYTRMLQKNIRPTETEMIEYTKSRKEFLNELVEFLKQYDLLNEIKFPYGNSYGWGFSYYQKKKMICILFPEDDAFSVMIRLTNENINNVYDKISEYTKNYLDNKYPCNDGGWIHYRVLDQDNCKDIKLILNEKLNHKK